MKMQPYELEYDFLEASKTGTLGERVFHSLRVKNMLRMIKGHDLKILDVGCGTGILLEHICKNNNHVTAVDISEYCIKKARLHAKKLNLSPMFYVGDAFKLDFRRNQFDLIILSGVLEHLRGDLSIVARKIHRLLKYNGRVLISLPACSLFNPLSYNWIYDLFRKFLSRRKDIDEEGEHRHFTTRELKNIFRGFTLTSSRKTALGT